jgi:hypothetical protein
MLTLRRFTAMADSYGADLQRWPDELRGEAEALLQVSAMARAHLEAALTLDRIIDAASADEDVRLWPAGEEGAALARLRSGVAARIAAVPLRRPTSRRFQWALAIRERWRPGPELRWIGMATGGGFAIMAGLLLGSLYTTAPTSDTALSMLQPAPIHSLILAD